MCSRRPWCRRRYSRRISFRRPRLIRPAGTWSSSWPACSRYRADQYVSAGWGPPPRRASAPARTPGRALGLSSDPRDAEVVAEAVRVARRLAATEPLSDLLVTERLPGADVADADLAEAVARTPSLYNHGCGTVRMGPDEDVMAVVDGACRVRGVQELFVVDASVLPAIPRVPINPTTIALAEKFAAELHKAG